MTEPTAKQIKDQKIYQQWGLTDSEYQLISDQILKRLPNYTETGLYSVMWSEHCSYKNSKKSCEKCLIKVLVLSQVQGKMLEF
ncbi:hypothetical protein LCR01_02660 [Companilactobacillus crustorum]|uniref:Phosphoribosylformylglycinamidine synthase linker domain-containing protein n=1 Tax=Companilactobacillus crustorum TaxID=392416 RepID=A0AB34A940_9LACO|nr:hypothetical protein LCR01_02660 [Companilactobacillus crustorum]